MFKVTLNKESVLISKMIKKFLLLSFVFLMVPCAWAGISVEPYAGTGIGKFNSWRYGYSAGARVGYSKWGVEIGLDAHYSRFLFFDLDVESIQPDCENTFGLSQIETCKVQPLSKYIEQTDVGIYNNFFLGPSVSFGLPLIVDGYASLGWTWSKTSFKQEIMSLAGPTAKVGVSYLNLPFLRVSLELQALLMGCTNNKESIQKICLKNTTFNYNVPVFIGQIYLSVPINTGLL